MGVFGEGRSKDRPSDAYFLSLSPGPQMNYPEGYSCNLAIGEGDEVGYQDSLTLSIMSTLGVWK